MNPLLAVTEDPDAVGEYVLAPDRSSITFKATSIWGLLPVRGSFSAMEGRGELLPEGRMSGRLVIEAASLHTGIRKRDEHLRAGDFFDVARYPQITVDISNLRYTASGEAVIDVNIRVKDVGNDLALPVEVAKVSRAAVRVTATATIDRTRFGLSRNIFGFIPNGVGLYADLQFDRMPR